MSHINNLHPSLPGYSFAIISENTPALRPKIDKRLVNKSPTYEVIKGTKNKDKSLLIQSIQENRKVLVESTIVQGLTKNRPFADCTSALNLDPQDPSLVDLENRYARYSDRLTKIPVKKLIAKTFPSSSDKENTPPRNSHPPHVLQDYAKRVKLLADQPINGPLTKFNWANHINKGLDPSPVDEEFLKTRGALIQNYYRDLFNRADLTELVTFQQICQLAIEVIEIQQLLSGPKPKKLSEILHHPGYIALLQAYQVVLNYAKENQIKLERNRCPLNDDLIYINHFFSLKNPPADPLLKRFKAITHQIKETYELELNREMKIIHQLIHLDFQGVVNQLSEHAIAEKNAAQLNVLLKEQKKHTFMRFMQLPHYYSSFCNTTNAIAKYLSKEHAERGVRYIEFIQELISFQSKPSNQTDQGYRAHHFMDLSQNPKEILEAYAKDINVALNASGLAEQPVTQLERAHTMPFPGAFSWEPAKIVNLLEPDERLSVQEAMIQNIYCPADLYFALKNRTLSQQDFEAEVIKHLDQKTTELKSAPSILHYALLFTHVFYLRLHSETELLPDLINHKLDNLSEWQGSPFKSTYKEALGGCLVQLLQETKDNDGIHVEDVVRALNTWYTGPIVVRTKEALAQHQEDTPLNGFMRIAIAQIHQSLLQILVDPDQKLEIEKTWVKKPAPAIESLRV